MRRRAFLAGCVTAGIAGLGGCLGETDTDTPEDRTAADTPVEPTPSEAPTGSTAGDTSTDRTASEGTTGWTSTVGTTPALFPGYETTEVRVTAPEGDLLGSVVAAVADTPELRFTGLSDTECLPEDRAMLFVYDSPGEHTYVMRRMDFGIDIVYADADGAITQIHHAPEPGPGEDGEDQEYPGYGQYVIELAHEWTTERGVETGDVLRFER
jgi:uncharacterized membrane protein (UPF0127 family)